MVGIGFVLLPVVAGLFLRWTERRVSVLRRLSDVRVGPGTRLTVSFDVENRSTAPSSFLMLEDQLPPTLGRSARLVVASVPGRRAQRVSYSILPQVRGRYRIGPLTVNITDAFGLRRKRLVVENRDELLVTPEIEDLSTPPDAATSPNAGAARARQLLRTGEEYFTMRAYQEGDYLRGSTGRRSPRTGELMIRQNETSKRANGLVFLDNRESALGRSHAAAFERAVSCAASVGALLARNGFGLRFGTADAAAIALSEERFLDALAGVVHGKGPSLSSALTNLRGAASADASLVFIAAPPAPQELPQLIRSGSGFGPKLVDLDPSGRAGHRSGQPPDPIGSSRDRGQARPDPSGLGLLGLDPVDEVEGTMARTAGTTARIQRLTALVAIELVAIAVGFAFGRVFIGHGATYRLLAVSVASALVAWTFERRSLLLATAVSAVLLVVAIGIIVFPATTWFGAPTLETLHQMGHAAAQVGEEARIQISPAPPNASLMLAAITAVWAAVFSCFALAFRAGSPLLSLVPPVALVAFADSVLDGLTQADLRGALPDRRARRRVRRLAPADPRVGPRLESPGCQESSVAVGGPRGAPDRRRRRRARRAGPHLRARVRLEGRVRPVIHQRR